MNPSTIDKINKMIKMIFSSENVINIVIEIKCSNYLKILFYSNFIKV